MFVCQFFFQLFVATFIIFIATNLKLMSSLQVQLVMIIFINQYHFWKLSYIEVIS